MQGYKKIHQARVRAARRRLRLKRQRWGKNTIIRHHKRHGVKHG